MWLFILGVKTVRPRARRALITRRPFLVRIRRRNPWTRTRRRILGWYVRFGMVEPSFKKRAHSAVWICRIQFTGYETLLRPL